jgi:hypothetical protein
MELTHLILVLQALPGVGDKTLTRALAQVARERMDVDKLLSRDAHSLAAHLDLPKESGDYLVGHRERLLTEAAEDARWLRRCGASILTQADAAYPSRLVETLEEPPAALFAYGQIGLLQRQTFAVACSNKSSDESLTAVERAVDEKLESGKILITGHNRVEYQRPALVAKRVGAPVCYVLDRGLLEAFGGDLSRELFPAARIWSPAYDPALDLTISPFALRKPYVPSANQRRDEIVFALADEVIAGSIRAGGRMEKECVSALSRGVSVSLVHPAAVTELLVERGAKLETTG